MSTTLIKAGAVTLLAMSMAACSSMPAPTTELAVTEKAVKDAEIAGAREYAPLELRRANEKYEAAELAMQEEDYESAKLLTDEALVDAELAEAKSYSEKSKIALQELRDSIDMMRSEITRAQGS
ncbi:DUF4398 domain-containing protein [Granulosicoccaceae sp. 1_MG-2023]|nr:DUF4398 domain-containing protein [Granulosicoccaceae sp. 1_MG-2023]